MGDELVDDFTEGVSSVLTFSSYGNGGDVQSSEVEVADPEVLAWLEDEDTVVVAVVSEKIDKWNRISKLRKMVKSF